MKTETNNKGDAELYADTGNAYVYAIHDSEVVWGACHRVEFLESAVDDLLAIVEGHDPVDEGWEHGTAEGESDTAWAGDIRFCEDAEAPREVANTYCYDGVARSLLALDRNGWPVCGPLAELLLGVDWEDMWDAGN